MRERWVISTGETNGNVIYFATRQVYSTEAKKYVTIARGEPMSEMQVIMVLRAMKTNRLEQSEKGKKNVIENSASDRV